MDLSFLVKLLPNKVQATSYMITALGNSGWIYAYLTDKLCSPTVTACESRDLVTQIAIVATPAIVALIWGQLNKTNASQVANVAAMPAVQKIVVNDNAGDGVGEAAADPAQLKVLTVSADKQSGTG